MNLELAKKVLANLASQGVRDICLCPGARNAPFVEILSKQTGFNVLSFFDERSAGFFALGRARRDQRPVVVLTTSGTAVAELLPAAIEAFYTDTCLVLLTADRPKRLRGTGAPQCIDQSSLFEKHVEKSWDIDTLQEASFRLDRKKPYQINICFDEPLIDEEVEQSKFLIQNPSFEFLSRSESIPHSFTKSLIVVGALESRERENVAKVLSELPVPLFFESASGLRGRAQFGPNELKGGEKIVSQMLKSGEVENVIRLGDIPLGRYWRDLDQMKIPVFSFSSKNFKGTDKSKLALVDLSSWAGVNCLSWDWSHWAQKGKEVHQNLRGLIQEFPQSELGFINAFQSTLSEGESFYIGNSLPIRLWDLVCDQPRGYRANRGVNGIDGQVSTALGWMQPESRNRIVVGDLTALYDFNGLWISPYLKANKINVELVVLNNGGGKIFSRIFSNSLFENQHQLSFQAMADFWSWNYSRVEKPQDMRPSEGLRITEWVPSSEQTQLLWDRYDQLWKI